MIDRPAADRQWILRSLSTRKADAATVSRAVIRTVLLSFFQYSPEPGLRRKAPAALAATFIASFLLFTVTPLSLAQSDPEPRRTTMGGIYTTAQATRGEESYFSLCVSCHPAGTMHSEPAFSALWAGRPLSDLYDAIKDKMPKNDPGTLTPEESVQLVAYLLKSNGMPAGKTELTTDTDVLKKIKIETRAGSGKSDGPAK
jgi:mono/diheme cytochrome c family protein